MRNRLRPSAGATYLDRDGLIRELEASARRAAGRLPAIRRVVLFGSLVRGLPTPRSDADLLIVLADSPHADPRQRQPEVLLAFRPLPCPLDLMVVTEAEVAAHGQESPVLRLALSSGRDLL